MTLAGAAPRPEAETLAFADARLVLPGEVVRGSLLVRDSAIASVDPGPSAGRGAIDCGGDFLAPGLIELHTDNLERHLRPRPGVAWPVRQAIVAHDAELASTGITTVFDALRVGSILSDGRGDYRRYARPLCDEILALGARGALRIAHRIHLRAEICSETLLEELGEFGPGDRIGIVSLMDHTPGQRQFADLGQMRTYLKGKYAMSDEAVEAHFVTLRAIRARHGEAHERGAVERARALGARLASHDDTTPEQVRASAANGVRLAEFPTTMAAAEACARHGVAVMMGAPNLLRGRSHSGNVAAGDLAAAGLLDILSSDYAPSSLLAAAAQLGMEAGDMAAGLAPATAAPARAAGLPDRGRLEAGLRADLVRFAMDGDAPIVRGVWSCGRRVG